MKTKQIWHNIGITSLAIIILAGTGYVFAAPTTAPDGTAGVYAPLNVGPDAQIKQGNLTVQGTLSVNGEICMNGDCSDSLGGGTTTTQVVTITNQNINCSFGQTVQQVNNSVVELFPFPGAGNIINQSYYYANYGNQNYAYWRDNDYDTYPEYVNLATCNQTFTVQGQVTTGTASAVLSESIRCRLSGYATTNYYVPAVIQSSDVNSNTNTYTITGYCPMPVTHTTGSSGGWNGDDNYTSTGTGNIEGTITVLISL